MRREPRLRWLLRLLPRDLRADHGGEIEQAFREEHRAARVRGRAEVMKVWWSTVMDVGRVAPREHVAQIARDASHAFRLMRRSPSFTAVAVLTLALGIGVNSAIFSLFHAVLLQPLPYADPGRLVAVWNHWQGNAAAALSDPELMDYAERSRTLRVAGLAAGAVNVGLDAGAQRVRAAYVTADLLPVLGVAPILGRNFDRREEDAGAPEVVLLTHRLWERQFQADPDILGRSIPVNGLLARIVGVTPPGLLLPSDFRGDGAADLLLPLRLDRSAPRDRRGGHYLTGIARLTPGAGIEAARGEMNAIVAELDRLYPAQGRLPQFGVSVVPLSTDLLGPARPVLAVLLGSVALVLLLACANMASLLLARGEARRRELAVRAALGADRFRLVRQLLTEACVLGAAGGIAGLLVAELTMKGALALDPATLPRAQQATLSLPVLLFTLALSLAAGALFGLLPAAQISGVALEDVLREAGRSSVGGPGRMRRLLVAAQVAIAVVLLSGAGLLLKSFTRLRAVPSGFDTEGVLTFRTTASPVRYPARGDVAAFYARLLGEVRAVPGVTVAGAGSGLPMAVQSGDWSFDVEGRAAAPGARSRADWYVVTPGYFEALGVRPAAGRLPAELDDDAGPPVLFLNQAAARAWFPGEDPIGRRVRLSRTTGPEQPWRTIAGVVADLRQRGLDRPASPEMYIPLPQFRHFMAGTQAWAMTVVVKASLPMTLPGVMRAAVRRVDPEVAAADIRAMDDVVSASLGPRRRDAWLIGGFAALALTVAAIGLHGVTAYYVEQRRREIGLRVALGAQRRDVVRMVLGQGMGLVVAGLAAGVPAALAAARVLRPVLFEVTPHDLTVFAAIPTLLAIVAASACAVPALRAARVDAAITLRDE